MIKVSVIVPIYKVQKFIRICVESLMRQTLEYGVEYIFVDDCSPDDSIRVLRQVLEQYPARHSQVKVVTHEVNRGLPSARNTGLFHARGEYVFHCDSDDWLEIDALEQLVKVAEKEQSDMVWCDWFLSFEHNERYMRQPSYATADEALRGMLRGNMKYNVWNKLVRRSLYEENSIRFPDGHSMGEDMTMIHLMACARSVAYVPKAFYHYVKTNGEALTQTFSERHLQDIQYNVRQVENVILRIKGECYREELAYFKLNVKFPFLISSDLRMYRLWQNWYPEANVYINRLSNISWRSKLLQQAAVRNMFWVIRLYYMIVYRFIYGVIYK